MGYYHLHNHISNHRNNVHILGFNYRQIIMHYIKMQFSYVLYRQRFPVPIQHEIDKTVTIDGRKTVSCDGWLSHNAIGQLAINQILDVVCIMSQASQNNITAPKGQFTQCVYLLRLGSRYVIQVFHRWGYHLSHTVVIRVATGIPTVKLPVPQTVKPVMTSITRAVKHQFHSPGIQPVSHSVEQVSTGLTSW